MPDSGRHKDPARVVSGRLGAFILHSRHDGLDITARARSQRSAQFREQAQREALKRGEKLTSAELERRARHLLLAHMER